MSAHEFLSPAWIEAAMALREEYGDQLRIDVERVAINVVVIETPWGDAVEVNVDNTEGTILPRPGLHDDVDMTVTTDHETAKILFVEQDLEGVMMAFLTGKIRVDGDMTRLLAFQSYQPTPEEGSTLVEIANRLRDSTLDE